MKKIYVISKYRASCKEDTTFNANVARVFARKIMLEGNIPVAPHLYYTQFLNEDVDKERNLGLEAGRLALTDCDEFLLVLVDEELSEGMKQELAVASRRMMSGHAVCLTKKDAAKLIKLGLSL